MSHNTPETSGGQRNKNVGQWGPRGSQSTTSVRASLRALFLSKPVIWSARGLLLFLLAFVTWQSLTPTGPSGNFPHADKVMHAIAYAALSGLAVLSGLRPLWMAILLATLWGAGIEAAQALMALGREGSLADGFANLIGAGFGVGCVRLFMGRE